MASGFRLNRVFLIWADQPHALPQAVDALAEDDAVRAAKQRAAAATDAVRQARHTYNAAARASDYPPAELAQLRDSFDRQPVARARTWSPT